MKKVEYQALRKITGAYQGSSHQKLGWIANVEPLGEILDNISVQFISRAVRTGDQEIRMFFDYSRHPQHPQHSEAPHTPQAVGKTAPIPT